MKYNFFTKEELERQQLARDKRELLFKEAAHIDEVPYKNLHRALIKQIISLSEEDICSYEALSILTDCISTCFIDEFTDELPSPSDFNVFEETNNSEIVSPKIHIFMIYLDECYSQTHNPMYMLELIIVEKLFSSFFLYSHIHFILSSISTIRHSFDPNIKSNDRAIAFFDSFGFNRNWSKFREDIRNDEIFQEFALTKGGVEEKREIVADRHNTSTKTIKKYSDKSIEQYHFEKTTQQRVATQRKNIIKARAQIKEMREAKLLERLEYEGAIPEE